VSTKAGGLPNDLQPLSPALVAILAEVHGDFLRFLKSTLGNTPDAEDVMQQFYLRVLLRSADLRRQASARIWLRRVLMSVLTDFRRRAARRRRAEADFARKEAAVPPIEEDLDAFICMCLHKLLPVLKPEYAEVLRLVDLEGIPRSAVAGRLGISFNALTVRLHRARQGMRQALELTCETCPVHGHLDCGCDYTKGWRLAQSRRVGEHPKGSP
jgi:RNA polymerase sigma-70 factor (ECF subfamily)